ncbi:MAG: penicillin-binding protein 1C [Hyphomicrobium sp.]|jgi:penicillin-binding protein 1C
MHEKAPRILKPIALVATVLGVLTFAAWGGLQLAVARLDPLPLADANQSSVTVLDRENRLLRAFTTTDGRWRLPVEVGEVDPHYLAILMAYEDKRFYEHGGVDYLAYARAGYLLARHGRLLSGGSTLTMQVARLLEGKHERTGLGKLRQIVRAKQLEAYLTKTEILKLYLRLAPFGGNIEGVRAASLAYFGKEPRHLSPAEAALLVALPQSPERRRPDRNIDAARRARNHVLDRAVEKGVLLPAEAERAKSERVPTARLEFPKLAPHLSETEVAANPARPVHRLTLDRNLQAALETLAAEQTKLLGQKLSAAIMAVDSTTGEVLAHVGSADYLDQSRWGGIDMTAAVRSPGSTLKPFIYGLAFEGGLAHPETLIEDRPTRFGTYTPENFDEEFHGTVTIRQALGNSLNVPAVKVLSAVGPGKLVGRFRRAGISPKFPAEAEPSLAIALGGIGLSMRDLVSLYAGLAQGGEPVKLSWSRDTEAEKLSASDAKRRRLLSPVAAWYVTDILREAPPPPNMKGGQIAYKTGTSYGYRDAWAIGYDGKYTIAVWVGRPDAASTPGLMGRLSAAPILFDAFTRISERRAPFRPAVAGVVNATGATLPPPLKRFREAGEETAGNGPFIEQPVLISFPPDRSELDVAERDDEPLVLKAEGGALPLTWLVDGTPLTSEPNRRGITWKPDSRGFVKLSVVDAKGRADRVTVRLR